VAEGFSWAASRKPRLWRGSAPRAAPGQAALSGWGLLMGSYHLGGGMHFLGIEGKPWPRDLCSYPPPLISATTGASWGRFLSAANLLGFGGEHCMKTH